MPNTPTIRPSGSHCEVAPSGPLAFTCRGPDPASGARLLAITRDERLDAIRDLGALAGPVIDAREVEAQFLLRTLRTRIEEADLLEARATLALALVGHHDVVEGLVLAAPA